MSKERKQLIKTDQRASDIGRQGESKPVSICPECSGRVVWCKSSRTGKFYLADVETHTTAGNRSRLIYNAGVAHFGTCGDRQQRASEWDLHFKKQENQVEFRCAVQELIWAGKNDEAEALRHKFETTGEVA